MRRYRGFGGPSSRRARRGLASGVVLEPGDDPVPRRSAVSLDSVESVSVGVLVDRLGEDRMDEVCVALDVAVGCGRSSRG